MNTIDLKHTPGPWIAFDRGTGLDEGDNLYSIWSIHSSKAGNRIAEIRQEGGSDASIANPILMAAAPLLLSALIKAVEDHGSLEAWFNEHKSNMRAEYPVPDWINEAKDAIAAAGVIVKASQHKTDIS